jgi:hypothetical protein
MAWGIQKGRRRPQAALSAGGRPQKAVSEVVSTQGVEGLCMASPGETLESPWIPLAIRACLVLNLSLGV